MIYAYIRVSTDRQPSREQAAAQASEKPVCRQRKHRKIVVPGDSDRAALQETASRRHLLSGHEKNILRMLKKGLSKAYIARYLGCNIKTLDAHLRRMGVKVVWE